MRGFDLDECTKRALYRNWKQPVVSTWENKKWNRGKWAEELSLECVKEKLIDIEQNYVKAIEFFNRSWTSKKRREQEI